MQKIKFFYMVKHNVVIVIVRHTVSKSCLIVWENSIISGCGTGETITNLFNQQSSEVDSSYIYSGIHKAKNLYNNKVMAIFSSAVQLVGVISSCVALSILYL